MRCGECKAFIENEDCVEICQVLSCGNYNYVMFGKDECVIEKWTKQRDALNAKENGDEAQKW